MNLKKKKNKWNDKNLEWRSIVRIVSSEHTSQEKNVWYLRKRNLILNM